MHLGVALIARAQSSEVVQVREAALDDPPLNTEPGAVFGAPPGDDGLDPARPQQPTVLVVVVAAIGQDEVGLLARPAGFASHRRGMQQVEQRQQLGDVVAVTAGQRDRQRDAGGIDEQVVL